MTILLTGGNGVLGQELRKLFQDSLCPSHKEMDVCNKADIITFFEKNNISDVIHTAALTSVRTCENNKDLAWNTNVIGTQNLVDVVNSSKHDIRFTYVSTACVFDGHSGMYKESSLPYPENFYALTKLLGEREVSKLKEYLIIRTNFVGKKKWPYPKAFTDRFGTYLFANDVAKGILDVKRENLSGIVHIVGDKKLSMYELAKLTTPEIQPMTMQEYDGPRLTIDMTLDTERWKKYKISNCDEFL